MRQNEKKEKTFLEKINELPRDRFSESVERLMYITDYKDISKGALKASFNVFIPTWDLTIRGMKLFVKDSGTSWFSYPSLAYKDAEGKTKYYQYVLFGDNSRKKFEDRLREEL